MSGWAAGGEATSDYRNAPSGIGPLADEWADKPHRLVYDLANRIDALEAENECLWDRLAEADNDEDQLRAELAAERALADQVLDAFYCRNGKTNVDLLDAIEGLAAHRAARENPVVTPVVLVEHPIPKEKP